MSRTPVPVRTGRSLGDILRGVMAFLALAVLVLGVPASLAYVIGWPLPTTTPSLDMLRQDISFSLFVDVLTVAVWVAWAQFTACVLVEVKAAVSGVGIPARVPGAGPSQLLARNLVASLLLLSSSAAGLVPGLSSIGDAYGGPTAPGPAVTAQQLPGEERVGRVAGGLAEQAGQDASAEVGRQGSNEQSGEDTKFYRIQPPEGRHHDTLWGVAERYLGDGKRYREIYQLNKDRLQPDGSKLTEASLIRPGWVMEMPADARGGELVEMPDEAPEVSPQVREQIADYQRTDEQAGGEQIGGKQIGGEQASGQTPQKSTPAANAGTYTGPADTEQAEQAGHSTPASPEQPPEDPAPQESAPHASDAERSDPVGLPEVLLGAPLLAVGLLGALGRRRRQALWQSMARPSARGVGHGFEPPEGPATDARDALLVAADSGAVRFLDRTLRGLAATLAAERRQLPAVYAAWLGTDVLHLQLTADAGAPPAPWSHDPGSGFWTIDRATAAVYDEEPLDDTTAPFPGLVSLGTREGIRLLLNLETVPGLVALSGRPEDRTALLASVAAELATNGWSDRLAVSLVGFGGELCDLAPTRMRHIPDVQALLEVVEAETELRRRRLTSAGYDSVLTGRVASVGDRQWAPHLVLVGPEPTAREASRLADLAAGSGDIGFGYLVSTREDLPGAVWHFDLGDDGRLFAPLMGLELEAQLLPEAQRAAVVELFTAANTGSGTDADPGFTVDLSERGRPSVYARLLGPYEISGIEEPDEARSTLLREALAMLLLHREGVHPQVLASALWPRGVTDDVRDALLGRLVDWLGSAPHGSPLLTADASGRLVLAASVVSDWDVLRTLHHETDARQASAGAPSPVRRRRLNEALDLARGKLLQDRADGRYGWLAHELVEAQYPVLVADVALALAAEYCAVDKPKRATRAVRRGLDAAPSDERLWNELLRAAHATGEEDRLAAVAEWLLEHNRSLHGEARGLPSPTEALLDELWPSWRTRTADVG